MRQLKHSRGQVILRSGVLVRRQLKQVVVRIALGACQRQRAVLEVCPNVARRACRRRSERAVLEGDESARGPILRLRGGRPTYAIRVLLEDHGAGEAGRVVEGALQGGYVVGHVADEEDGVRRVTLEVLWSGY